MKKLLPILIAFASLSASAQPAAGLFAEPITILEPALTTITNSLGAIPYTWRVYANIPSDYEVQIVYGDMFGPLAISTPGTFYQDPLGAGTTLGFTQTAINANPELGYDSWLTIGATESTNNMIMVVPNSFLAPWEAGGDLLVNDLVGGGVFITTEGFNTQNTPDVNGNVLIAQITATSDVALCLNFQIRRLNPDGSIYTPLEFYQYTNQCAALVTTTIPCPGDFDGSGMVTIPDLLTMLVDFGCTSGCSTDLDGDGSVLVDDFLIFLSYFGNLCQ